jgi:hypothetical protein
MCDLAPIRHLRFVSLHERCSEFAREKRSERVDGAQTARSGVNYLALICAVAIVAVPGVIVGSLLLTEFGAFPRAANIFDASVPSPVALMMFIANVLMAIGAGIIIYGIAFKRAAACGEREFWPYFIASLWALIGVYLAIHLAIATYFAQSSGASLWLAVMGPIGIIGLSLVYASMTEALFYFAVGGAAACLIGTTLVAFLYWSFSRLPAFASSLAERHLQGAVIAAIVAAVIGAVFMTLTLTKMAGEFLAAALLTMPISAIGTVAQFTVVALVAEAIAARRGERLELFGWVGAFAIGLTLIAIAETALIGSVSVLDAQTPKTVSGYLWHRLITLPQLMLASGVVGFVYGRVIGATRFVWTANG